MHNHTTEPRLPTESVSDRANDLLPPIMSRLPAELVHMGFYHARAALTSVAHSRKIPRTRRGLATMLTVVLTCVVLAGTAVFHPREAQALSRNPAPMRQQNTTDADPTPALSVDLNGLIDSLTQGRTDIRGRTISGARIEVYLDNAFVGGTTADVSGNWRADVSFGAPGERSLLILARDIEGLRIGVFGPIVIVVPGETAEETAFAAQNIPPGATPDPAWQRVISGIVAATPLASATPLPTFTPVPTFTPLPTFTPTPVVTATPVATATPAPTDLPLAPVMPVTKPTAVPTPTSAPQMQPHRYRLDKQSSTGQTETAAGVALGTVKLISPEDMVGGEGRRTFAWETDITLPPGMAFELIFWKKNQDPMATGFGLAAPTQSTSISVDLNGLDHSLGNLLQPGLYNWGVLLVEVDPYRRVAFVGGTNRFRFDRTY